LTLINSLNLTKESKEVITASFDTKIVDLDKQGFQSIYLVLLKWCKFLGIKEAPDREEMTMILMFIKKHFGDLTGTEVSTAFGLAVAKKLDVDPNHYQNFSPLYVGGILDAYKQYRGSHITQYRDKLMAHEEQLKMEANKPSAEELATMRMDALLKIWDDFKEAEDEEVSWQVHVYYDILVDAGLMDMDSETKKDILERAKKLCKREAERQVSNEFKRNRVINEINQHSASSPSQKVLNRCKLLASQRLFEKLISEGLDLREKLNLTEHDRPEIA